MQSLLRGIGITLGRSFFPLATLVVILGTLLWGPWYSLLIMAAIYIFMKRLA
jgi:hypothetical protein